MPGSTISLCDFEQPRLVNFSIAANFIRITYSYNKTFYIIMNLIIILEQFLVVVSENPFARANGNPLELPIENLPCVTWL